MWLELDSKKTSQFRNSPWLLKTFWNQDLNFVLLAYLSTIPGTGASENICTLIRTLGKATCLDFISEHCPNRQTSPYWFSIWVETIPKQWIYFGIWGIFFLVVGSISVNGWMNETVSFLSTLRTCVVMFICMEALSVIQIKVCLCCFVEVTEAKTFIIAWKENTFDQLAVIESCFPTEYKQQRVWNPRLFMLTYWLVLCNFMQDMFLICFPTSLKYAPWGASE